MLRLKSWMRSVCVQARHTRVAPVLSLPMRYSPRHVSQQCVHLLWTQHQQSEHKYEQDFGTQAPDSPLGNAVLGNGRCGSARFSSSAFMPALKPRMLSPSPLPNSGSFLGPNTSKAIPKIISKCIGWNSPSNIFASQFLVKRRVDSGDRRNGGRRRPMFQTRRPTRQLASVQERIGYKRTAASASAAIARTVLKNCGLWPMKSPSAVKLLIVATAPPNLSVSGRMIETGGSFGLNSVGTGKMRLG